MSALPETTHILARYGQGRPLRPDGRIDYTGAACVPLLSCFLQADDRVLVLKRSAKVRSYPGKWCAVARIVDRPRDLRALVEDELRVEVGLAARHIVDLVAGEDYLFRDEMLGRDWHVYPILVHVAGRPRIEIDWEHVDFAWVRPEDLARLDTVPMLEESLRRVLSAANR